jgi:hypothetical protein
MDNSTTAPVPNNENITYSNNKCCNDCKSNKCCNDNDYTEDWCNSIEYCCFVTFCFPCICIDKCGGCKEESKSTPNNFEYGIAIGMLLRQ